MTTCILRWIVSSLVFGNYTNLRIFLIRISFIHLLFLQFRFDSYFQSLISISQFLFDFHIIGCRWKALFYNYWIITFKTHTCPWKLNPNPSFVIIVTWNMFRWFLPLKWQCFLNLLYWLLSYFSNFFFDLIWITIY